MCSFPIPAGRNPVPAPTPKRPAGENPPPGTGQTPVPGTGPESGPGVINSLETRSTGSGGRSGSGASGNIEFQPAGPHLGTGIERGLFHNYGYPHGPRTAPEWSYPGIPNGGAFITYPPPPPNKSEKHLDPGKYDGTKLVPYSLGSFDVMSNGFCLYGPQVPVYGPIPTFIDSKELNRQFRTMNKVGLAGYGWHGLYNASPRPPLVSTSVRPALGNQDAVRRGPPPPSDTGTADKGATEKPGVSMTVSVKVPQAGAELLVDGKPTAQTGTDRTFESPPLEPGARYKYTITVRWVEAGQKMELTKEAAGTPGDVVRLDFSR